MSTLFVHDSDTSEAAARSIDGRAMRYAILTEVRARRERGLTTDEIEVLLDIKHQTASARVFELKNEGLLIDSGRRRPTRSNRMAMVLVAETEGEAVEL